MLRSDLCCDAYIVVKLLITVAGTNPNNRRNKKLIFKNNALFRSCITKINNTFVDDAENLDIVMPMYNLLEYIDNYRISLWNLWNYYRDEINDDKNENDDNGNKINHSKTATSKSFKYKTKIIGSTPDNASELNAKVVVPLKYLSNIWRSLDLPLINCEIELDLRWTRNCIISEISRIFRAVDSNGNL